MTSFRLRLAAWITSIALSIIGVAGALTTAKSAALSCYGIFGNCHIVFFITLTLTVSIAVSGGWRQCLGIAVALMIYGAGIEGLQALTNHRDGSLMDIGINSIGITIGILLYLAIRKLYYRYLHGT